MTKKFDLVGLTNALSDVIINIKEDELSELGLVKGAQCGIRHVDTTKLKNLLSERRKHYCVAGSPANTILNASALGLRTALLGTIGGDRAGKIYEAELMRRGVESWLTQTRGASGRCYVLVTPDGEKSCVIDMGVAGNFEFYQNRMRKSKVFHTSGYEVASNPENTLNIIRYMKDLGAKISFDFASARAVAEQRETIEQIALATDVIFMTEEEAEEFGGGNPEKAVREMSRVCGVVALKKGSRGSLVREGKKQYYIPVTPVKVVNTCGAGDAYAAGFLQGYINHFPIEVCGKIGSDVASRVCGMKNSHL